jgi:uncharacterized membrane protein YeaQ/YmgE (transglycosylase-associated protein family)
VLGAIIQVLVSGFIIGALARWAVPGPDPMSIPLTIMLGVLGSFIGGGIAGALFGLEQDSGSFFAILLGSILASTLLLVAYRRYVQHRPITGPQAHTPPPQPARAGNLFGSSARRRDGQHTDLSEQLRKLQELRDEGVLTEEEYEAKKARLLAGQ